MTAGGDAGHSLGALPPGDATAARLPLPWFRERDAAELAREAAQLDRMQQLERDAIAAGYNVRPIKR